VTFSPGYGLAEATLGVSCEQAERHAMAISAKDLDAWCGGGPEPALTPLDDRLLQTAEPEAWVVASGRPLEGVHVEISPIDGVPESAVGEIVARTPAACRHLDADGPAPEEIWTGDAGFLVDGHLFVLGRIGDAVKVHGRLVHAEDAEAALRSATGERDLRSCVVLGASSVGIQQLVLIVESTSPPEWLDAARLVLNQAVSGKVPCRYVLAGRGAVPRTSSGKPRRRQAWSMALSGAMGELRPLDLADADAMVGS
jgi:acyl-CoA synthetase (AMP-forming)/AMP-acid ligase II